MIILAFIWGLIFGSFYNVIIYRIPKNENIVFGRSKCTNCNKKLGAKDLFPILSYLLLKGKCRYCGAKINIQYPIVELITGISFSLAYYKYGISIDLFSILLLFSMLIIVSAIDYNEMVIYDSILIIFTFMNLLLRLCFNKIGIEHIFSLIICFIFYYLIYKLSYKFYKEEVFGLGDVYFIASIAVVIGYDAILVSVLSFYIALLIYVIYKLVLSITKNTISNTKDNNRTENIFIPFAPAISIATYIVIIFNKEIHYLLGKLL